MIFMLKDDKIMMLLYRVVYKYEKLFYGVKD